MKNAVIYNAFTDKEETVNLELITGLVIGGRVSRTAENQNDMLTCASSFRATIAKDKAKLWANGMVIDLDYAGFCPMRGNLITAKIQWDNGETYSVITSFVERA